jgi:hypothetical protein
MAELSSINFKKSNAINTEHNDRTLPPNYLLSDSLGVECSLSHDKARLLKNQIISSAIEKYTARTGQKFQSKSYEWSAVVNLKPSSTMAELQKLAAHLQEKYGFQCYQIAIHRDEGHINDKGENVLNHHAHLEFITLDKETGKNNYRRELITPQVLRNIQDEVAEILQMQRGVDKRLSGAKRIEPRAYAKMKENEKKQRAKELENVKSEIKFQANKEFLEMQDKKDDEISRLKREKNEIKAAFEQTRKEMIAEKNNSKKEYDELSLLKKALLDDENATLEQAIKEIQRLRLAQKQIKELNEKLSQNDRNGSNFALNQKIDELLQKNNKTDLKAENELLKHENENLNFITEKMSDELTLLRHRQNERVYFIDEVKEIIAYKDELDKTSQNLNDDINLNRYENSIDKQKTLNEMLQKATKTKQMLEANPQLESFFSFEKYKKVYERFTKWLKDKGFPLERTNKNSIER